MTELNDISISPSIHDLNAFYEKKLLRGRQDFTLAWASSSIDAYVKHYRGLFHTVMDNIYEQFDELGLND